MFDRHMINEKGIDTVDEFKSEFAQLTESMMFRMAEGKAKARFFTKMEEAIFWGTRAICEVPENCKEIIVYSNQAD